MRRRNGQRIATTQTMELCGDDARVASLGLVNRQEHRLAGTLEGARDVDVFVGETDPAIDHQDEPVGFDDRTLGLLTHQRFDGGAGTFDHTTGIDQNAGYGAHTTKPVLAVARDAGHVGDDGITRAGQRIEQRRLTDVRPSDYGNDR